MRSVVRHQEIKVCTLKRSKIWDFHYNTRALQKNTWSFCWWFPSSCTFGNENILNVITAWMTSFHLSWEKSVCCLGSGVLKQTECSVPMHYLNENTVLGAGWTCSRKCVVPDSSRWGCQPAGISVEIVIQPPFHHFFLNFHIKQLSPISRG